MKVVAGTHDDAELESGARESDSESESEDPYRTNFWLDFDDFELQTEFEFSSFLDNASLARVRANLATGALIFAAIYGSSLGDRSGESFSIAIATVVGIVGAVLLIFLAMRLPAVAASSQSVVMGAAALASAGIAVYSAVYRGTALDKNEARLALLLLGSGGGGGGVGGVGGGSSVGGGNEVGAELLRLTELQSVWECAASLIAVQVASFEFFHLRFKHCVLVWAAANGALGVSVGLCGRLSSLSCARVTSTMLAVSLVALCAAHTREVAQQRKFAEHVALEARNDGLVGQLSQTAAMTATTGGAKNGDGGGGGGGGGGGATAVGGITGGKVGGAATGRGATFLDTLSRQLNCAITSGATHQCLTAALAGGPGAAAAQQTLAHFLAQVDELRRAWLAAGGSVNGGGGGQGGGGGGGGALPATLPPLGSKPGKSSSQTTTAASALVADEEARARIERIFSVATSMEVADAWVERVRLASCGVDMDFSSTQQQSVLALRRKRQQEEEEEEGGGGGGRSAAGGSRRGKPKSRSRRRRHRQQEEEGTGASELQDAASVDVYLGGTLPAAADAAAAGAARGGGGQRRMSLREGSWREELAAPALRAAGISFFSPTGAGAGAAGAEAGAAAESGGAAAAAARRAARESASVLVYVIDDDTRAAASLAEATEYICRGRQIAVVIKDVPAAAVIDGAELGAAELRDLNRGRQFVRDIAARHGTPCFTHVETMLRHVLNQFKTARRAHSSATQSGRAEQLLSPQVRLRRVEGGRPARAVRLPSSPFGGGAARRALARRTSSKAPSVLASIGSPFGRRRRVPALAETEL